MVSWLNVFRYATGTSDSIKYSEGAREDIIQDYSFFISFSFASPPQNEFAFATFYHS